jgi:hypothetical protein
VATFSPGGTGNGFLKFTALPLRQVRLLMYSSERPNTRATYLPAGRPTSSAVLVNLGNSLLITKGSRPTESGTTLLPTISIDWVTPATAAVNVK